MDQSSRYARLDLNETDLLADGRHVLCVYEMRPKAGEDYLAAAAHFAAEIQRPWQSEDATDRRGDCTLDTLLSKVTAAIERLLDEGKAYRCYCSRERLEKLREDAMARGEKPRYDGHCRHLKEAP